MQKQIYTQSLMKVKYILTAGFLEIFFVWMFLDEFLNPSETGTDSTAIFPTSEIVLISGITIPLTLILITLTLILIIWLTMKKRIIAVDLVGCEVTTSRPFSQPQTERFEWKNVTSTYIVSQTQEGEGGSVEEHTFKVSTKGKSIDLITRGTVLRRGLVELMATVNAATPHLPYIWKECRTKESRRILYTIPPYCKISRR